MRIQVNRSAKMKRRFLRLFTLPRLYALAVFLGLMLITGAVGIIIGAHAYETNNEQYLKFLTKSTFATKVVQPALNLAKSAIIDDDDLIGDYFRMLLNPGKIDRLQIDIAHLDYQQIAFDRKIAMDRGFLLADGSEYVPATLRSGDNEVRAKLRLKGDLPDHWSTDKWSFRIKIRDGDTLFGMKRFSIQHPETRVFEKEWIAQAAMHREGLITLRYRFVDVTINGKHKGIYALEEHFDKRLIENNQRRDGPIIKFSEDLFWIFSHNLYRDDQLPGYATFLGSHIDGYRHDPALQPAFERAIGLLDSFRQGKLKTTEVFDGKQLAMFIALSELLGAYELDWQDLRFYYNPVTSRLEPIAFDLHTGGVFQRLFCVDGGIKKRHNPPREIEDNFAKLVYKDLEFTKLYVQALETVSSEEYIQKMFTDLSDEIQENLRVLHRDYPTIKWDGDYIRGNATYMRDVLSGPKAVHAYLQSREGGEVRLSVGCLQELPIEILGLAIKGFPLVPPREPIMLPRKRWKAPISYLPITFSKVPIAPMTEEMGDVVPDLELEFRIIGASKVSRVSIFPWPTIPDNLAQGDWLLGESQTPDHPCLVVDDETSTIFFIPGKWRIESNIIIPPGYRVSAGPGVELDLVDGAKIISFSPVDFQGSPEQMVKLHSTDATGQGLVVIQADEVSTLENVVFDNLGTPKQGGWEVTGAVTFYESNVNLKGVQFLNARAEDSLNIVRSQFTMENVLFSVSESDAFDGDFVSGSIRNCAFEDSMNDAIDLSGSVVVIEDVKVTRAGDKGVSVGERSEAIIRRLDIRDVMLGVAAKDLSQVTLENVQIVNSRIGLAAYQKKSEFGQASIDAVGLVLEGVKEHAILELGSSIVSESASIGKIVQDIDEYLYPETSVPPSP